MPNQTPVQATPQPSTSSSSTATHGASELLAGAAERATSLASAAKEEGAELLHQARGKATDLYREARTDAIAAAHEVNERTRHAREVTSAYVQRVGAGTGRFVLTNALPLAVIGAGLGWLVWNARSDAQRQRAMASPRRAQLSEDQYLTRDSRDPRPTLSASTTSGAKLMGVRVSDSGYRG